MLKMMPAEVRYSRTKPPEDCKGIEALILAGHRPAELRIIEQEICVNSKKPAATEAGRA